MEETKIKVKGNDNLTVGIQNNYNGLTPTQACELSIELFKKNFPELVKAAEKIALDRVNELMNEILEKAKKEGITNFLSFAKDPSMQYALITAQKEYAKYATDDSLDILASLITNRMLSQDQDAKLKIVIDLAIGVTSRLSENDINYLSVMFACKQVKFGIPPSIEALNALLNQISSACKYDLTKIDINYLHSLGCLILCIGNSVDILSKTYKLDKARLSSIIAEECKNVHGDYGVSSMGIAIAIINLNKKLGMNLDLKTFIK